MCTEPTDDSHECEFANFWLLASVQLHFFYYIIDSKETNGVILIFVSVFCYWGLIILMSEANCPHTI